MVCITNMRFVLQQCRADRCGVHQAVKILRLIVVREANGAELAVRHSSFHCLIGVHIVTRLAVMQDHQVNVFHTEPFKGDVNGSVTAVIVRGPHFGRDEHFLACHDTFVDGSPQASPHSGFIAVDSRCVDQAKSCLQRPVGGILRLRIRKTEHAQPQDRHLISAVEQNGPAFKVKYRIPGNRLVIFGLCFRLLFRLLRIIAAAFRNWRLASLRIRLHGGRSTCIGSDAFSRRITPAAAREQ